MGKLNSNCWWNKLHHSHMITSKMISCNYFRKIQNWNLAHFLWYQWSVIERVNDYEFKPWQVELKTLWNWDPTPNIIERKCDNYALNRTHQNACTCVHAIHMIMSGIVSFAISSFWTKWKAFISHHNQITVCVYYQ